MTEFVHVDQRVFERNAPGRICAGVWFSIGEAGFPEERWDDFATVILAAAVEAVQRLLEGYSKRESVHFMEGPYDLRMEVVDDVHMTISAISTYGKGGLKHEQVINMVVFALDLCAAAEELLSWCRPVGWIGRDEVKLEQSMASLRDTIARRTTRC
jgi:hypothetical protein